MKKEYIAVYVGMMSFFATFVVSSFFDRAGNKHLGQIFAATSVILLGTTMLVGLYSNMKNYGYFWGPVGRQDVNLSFAEMDKKYSRIKKNTRGYRVGMAIFFTFAVGTCIFGLALLLKEIKELNKASLLTPDLPPVPVAMTATTSTPCSTIAPGQA